MCCSKICLGKFSGWMDILAGVIKVLIFGAMMEATKKTKVGFEAEYGFEAKHGFDDEAKGNAEVASVGIFSGVLDLIFGIVLLIGISNKSSCCLMFYLVATIIDMLLSGAIITQSETPEVALAGVIYDIASIVFICVIFSLYLEFKKKPTPQRPAVEVNIAVNV